MRVYTTLPPMVAPQHSSRCTHTLTLLTNTSTIVTIRCLRRCNSDNNSNNNSVRKKKQLVGNMAETNLCLSTVSSSSVRVKSGSKDEEATWERQEEVRNKCGFGGKVAS
ncbi:unnamed protein product [Ceratitis capitata]|uniref:(Mediterranean fruit fly) hypothetical protein n=1 Tax=Ceratitis capitata TaxID=7213 RepID=A0A811U9R9_CERCA|nr:unnamed protein product [Ceratitis capitata]